VLGLSLGLSEAGSVAARLIPVVGVAYFAEEAAILYGFARIFESRGVPGEWAQLAAGIVPWLASWHNLGVIYSLREWW